MSKPIPFRIVGLKVEDFTITGQTPDENAPFEIRTSYEFGVSPKPHLVNAKLPYTYLQSDTELLTMTLNSIFEVKQDAFDEMLTDGIFTLEPFFLQYICTINVGAARGEIHARCEQADSLIAKVVLPPINLVEALPEPIKITIK